MKNPFKKRKSPKAFYILRLKSNGLRRIPLHLAYAAPELLTALKKATKILEEEYSELDPRHPLQSGIYETLIKAETPRENSTL